MRSSKHVGSFGALFDVGSDLAGGRMDPAHALALLADAFANLAAGPEDDARIVKAARSSEKALRAEAARWRRL